MPEISRFLGIIICMYYDDHNPPHFHAKYRNYEITIEIKSGLIKGNFPTRALNAVLEWHKLHQEELMADWELAINDQPLNKIEPWE
jgi:hypothetical protein